MPQQLTNGHYEIRYIPKGLSAPFPLGGMYATGKGLLGGPVTGEAPGPSTVGEQVWDVTAVDGKPNHFMISTPSFGKHFIGIGPVLPGWGLTGTGRNDIVNLQVQETEWIIQACDTEDDSVYTIVPAQAPKDASVGISYIVDLDQDNDTLFLNTWPKYLQGPIIARWQFLQMVKEHDN